jgi:hypothetical protein
MEIVLQIFGSKCKNFRKKRKMLSLKLAKSTPNKRTLSIGERCNNKLPIIQPL